VLGGALGYAICDGIGQEPAPGAVAAGSSNGVADSTRTSFLHWIGHE